MPKLRLNFLTLIWGAVGLALLWLFVWPLAMNAWAARAWRKTDCYIKEGTSFIYGPADNNGMYYGADRRDFWSLGKAGRTPTIGPINGTCWVNPSDPTDAVLFLDAPQRWDRAANRLLPACLALLAAGGLTWAEMRRRATGARKA